MMSAASREKPEPGKSVSIEDKRMQKVVGGNIEVDFNAIHVKTQYFDEYMGEPLPNDLVRAAMIQDMSYSSKKAVWTAADWADMKSTKDSTFVRTR